MKNRDRFLRVMHFEQVEDRLPMIEWSGWWDQTLARWRSEGLPSGMAPEEVREYLGLDMVRQFWLTPVSAGYPKMEHGKGPVQDRESYLEIKKHLYPRDAVENIKERLFALKPLHDRGDVVIWISLEGFFWFPRKLFGIENHLYAFYDQAGLMHEINHDLAEYNIGLVEEFCRILTPDFMTFAEDMSYNLGPMLSYELFSEFLLPYYKRVIPVLKKNNILPLVDTDGQVEPMIPWLQEAGIEGVLPLERQAGVDVARIRENYPRFIMIGAYDKMVMARGEAAMRSEFERLLPVMKKGGFIPSCDHQTPPGVSLQEYGVYLKLMQEYCKKAANP